MGDSSDLLMKLADLGGELVFDPYRSCPEVNLLRTSLMKNDETASMLFGNSDNSYSARVKYFQALKFACNAGLALSESKFWSKEIESTLSELPDEDDESYSMFYRSVWSSDKPHIYAAKLTPDYDWRPMFIGVWNQQVSCGYLRPQFMSCLDAFSKTDKDSFISFAKDNVFWKKGGVKPSYDVRSRVYQQYIEIGALDKKTARKIRSDGSEDASARGLKSLIKNLDLYDNSDELLLQFTDSKYESVILLLANNLPEYLLASIMGTEFYYPKRVIEQRLEEIERAGVNQSAGEM